MLWLVVRRVWQVGGVVLALIGLAGIPGDVTTWVRTFASLSDTQVRWLLSVSG
jgi:hypothetical protein